MGELIKAVEGGLESWEVLTPEQDLFYKIFQKASYSKKCWWCLCQAAAQVCQKLLEPLILDQHQLLWG